MNFQIFAFLLIKAKLVLSHMEGGLHIILVVRSLAWCHQYFASCIINNKLGSIDIKIVVISEQ